MAPGQNVFFVGCFCGMGVQGDQEEKTRVSPHSDLG